MTKPELEICIQEYGKEIYSFCRYLAGSVPEAEDLYQDTFLKALELNDRIDFQKNPKSWLLSIALRIWKNRKRKFAWRKRIADVQLYAQEQEEACGGFQTSLVEAQMLQKEEILAVRHCVQRLPDRLKVAVLLYYMEGLSTAQAAEVLKIPQGTVKSRLHQARKMLQKELEDVFHEKEYG